MNVLLCSAEVSPFAKVGGLADVAGSLPKALTARGHDVVVLMPGYGLAWDVAGRPDVVAQGLVDFGGRRRRWTLAETFSHGLRLWLIDVEGVAGKLLRSEDVYALERDDYLALTKASFHACEAMRWMPDVIHANDWHTGFYPVYLREWAGEAWSKVASVFTIHNFAYQGEFGQDTVAAAGLSPDTFDPNRLETFGGVNFIKSGCVYADQVNTVSPNYAREITTEAYGTRLWGLMRHLASLGKLHGILNGIDREWFDPATDPAIAASFSADDPSGKAVCRQALLGELGWAEDPTTPVLGVVSRLSEQKGFDLILQVAERMFALPARLVVLGKGSGEIAAALMRLERAHPDRVRLFEKFDVDLAQRIYAGSDLFLMPSAFEPCGLGQMIALRYGTIPVVRKTGGLADTVFEGRNGFVFTEHTSEELLRAVRRGVAAYGNRTTWPRLVQSAMREQFGWERSAEAYEALFQQAIRDRAGAALTAVA